MASKMDAILLGHSPEALLLSDWSTEGWNVATLIENSTRQDNRLQQIKEEIKSLEKAKLKEEVIARRQRKLLSRHARQKFLEEAGLREAELLQELHRENCNENLSKLNLEFDHRDENFHLQIVVFVAHVYGILVVATDITFSKAWRENGRAGNEGTRTSKGMTQPETATSSSMVTMPTVVLSGARQFSGQLPTILQSRDRSDENSFLCFPQLRIYDYMPCWK
ncbi:hypothetical protein RND71_007649 [Anisodus tanguticus]|uniref:Uncharacterized protein n=1 Tax=Anisodus tanguticus TaxID=243964 RepID=A0AAE1VTQ2_9SOLA|nr:hypothetical protein RND71_007649 [Anisodus tanguticus]